MRGLKSLALVMFAAALGMAQSFAGSGQLTLIHTGDFHGHLIPRPNLRSDAQGHSVEGGLARVYTVIKDIRKQDPGALLIHTGDTIQGSAEVLFTRGQAIVDIVNAFKIDAFAPGNWEFVYGTERFLELFAADQPKAPWNTIPANLHYATAAQEPASPYADKAGQRMLPPYVIKYVGAANGSLAPDVAGWTGGWLFNFSGVTMDFDPYQGAGQRAFNIKVGDQALDPAKDYSYASYWYGADPGFVNVQPAAGILVLKDADGSALDGAEVVVRYLESLPGKTAEVQLNRIRLKSKSTGEPIRMPPDRFGFPETQPLRGTKP